MAARAAGGDAGVNHPRTGERGEVADRVAGLAGRAGGSRHVNRGRTFGLRCHALERLAAMAGGTAADNEGVLHRRARERAEVTDRVAGLACRACGGGQVRWSSGPHALHLYATVIGLIGMAAGAAAADEGVTHVRAGERGEVADRVTALARVRARDRKVARPRRILALH